MNKWKMVFLLLGLVSIGLINAQETPRFEYSNAFKISPIEFGSSRFQITYERYINDRSSSFLAIPTIILKENGQESKKGFEMMLQYRFFLTHLRKGINKTLGMHNIGFYAGPYINGLVYNEEYQNGYYIDMEQMYVTDTFEKDVRSGEAGALIGVQFDITPKILLDLYVGGGIRYSDVTDTFEDVVDDVFNYGRYYDVFDLEYTGVKPKLGLQLGFAF